MDSIYDGDKIRFLIKAEEESELAIPVYEDIYEDDQDQSSDQEDGPSVSLDFLIFFAKRSDFIYIF